MSQSVRDRGVALVW